MATWFFGGCDAEQHTLAHFHRREVWIKGYFQPVPMHMDVQQDSPGATSSAGATLRVTLVERLKSKELIAVGEKGLQ